MSFDKSKISIKEAAKILKSLYNLDGEISMLDGEIDSFLESSLYGSNV